VRLEPQHGREFKSGAKLPFNIQPPDSVSGLPAEMPDILGLRGSLILQEAPLARDAFQ